MRTNLPPPRKFSHWQRFTLLFMLLLSGGGNLATAQLLRWPAPDCSQPQVYDYVIGNSTQTTVYNGNYTFAPGRYHVIGNLYFTNGIVVIPDGTTFYIDGTNATIPRKYTTVTGYSLTLGPDSRLYAEGAVFNASCNTAMWKGIFFEPNKENQVLQLTDCGVANAMYGLSTGGTGSPNYTLKNCRFEQNLYGVYDGANRYTDVTTIGSIIQDCEFVSMPNLLYPYRTTTGVDSWSNVALYLIPSGNKSTQPKVELSGTNTINGAIYGLIANQPGQGLVQYTGGNLKISRIVRTAIWLDVMKESFAPIDTYIDIDFNANPIYARSYQAMGTSPGEPMYGLVVTNNTGQTNKHFLSVKGGGTVGDTTNFRTQTGVLLDNTQHQLDRMTLTNLTFGASLRAGSALITNNTFTGCFQGVRIRPNTTATVNFDISCNSFTAPVGSASAGIYVAQNALLNNQGSLTYPVGNKFQGYGTTALPGTRSLINDGINLLNYYRFSTSTDEEIATVNDSSTPGQSMGSVISTFPSQDPNALPSDYCYNLRAITTGVQQRGTSRAAMMLALMDTLRRQAAPVARLGRYQAAIRQWLLAEQRDTTAFEIYVRTLSATNTSAFLGLGLDLLEQYRSAGRRGAAVAFRPALAVWAAKYPAASARLALSDVVSRLALTGPPLPGQHPLSAADSLALRRVATGSTGSAEMAALWFQHLYPARGLQVAPRSAARPGSNAQQVGIQAIYPNPAADQLYIEVMAPTGTVVVHLTNLISGKLVAVAEFRTGSLHTQQASLNVKAVPAGQYAATVLLDGVPSATRKVIINH